MAQHSTAPVGFLVPLKEDLTADDTAPSIPILQGNTALGRSHLAVPDKRVSRKHITLRASADGTAELAVEGQNPVILTSGGQRNKISHGRRVVLAQGDVIELIPGSNYLMFKKADNESSSRSSRDGASMPSKGKRAHEEDTMSIRRNRQICDDEALAQFLQDEENNRLHDEHFVSNEVHGCQDSKEPIRRFLVTKDVLSLVFRLMRVQGLPSWANTSSVSISEVIEGNVLVAILSNYMVDVDWLLSACPMLRTVPHVVIIHGESGATVDHLKKCKPANWILHKPPLPISYGTHHSKAMILLYPQGVRVIVHTANLIHVDWNNKTQGLWLQDFPWKQQQDLNKSCPFENDLVDYLSVLKWPQFRVNFPSIGHADINASFFRSFDYSSASVRLIASVPGYHTGSSLNKWGHMKLRTVLEETLFNTEFSRSPLVYQFSSLGSLDEKWLAEFNKSTSSGLTNDKTPLGLGKPLIIWPTVEDVRCSLEGYAAGNAIPSPQKNVEKDFLRKYWSKWSASHSGRCRAMPHIKTYTRYNGQSIAWFLLTSANLSKAAWGSLQKNSSQLMIRSYELGVLFLPTVLDKQRKTFSCTDDDLKQVAKDETRNDGRQKTKLVTLCWQDNTPALPSCKIISMPVPYELPPTPYSAEDVPWSWDRAYTKKDFYGQVWPRHVQLYLDDKS